MQEVPDLIGADGGKPPIRPLNVEMIDEFFPTIRRFVARFVALELRRQHQSQEVEVGFQNGSGANGLAALGISNDTVG
jgi:hypothetical protein